MFTRILQVVVLLFFAIVEILIEIVPLATILFAVLLLLSGSFLVSFLFLIDIFALISFALLLFIMLYIILDFVAGVTVRKYCLNSQPYKNHEDSDIIDPVFFTLKQKFSLDFLHLKVSPDSAVNAYAVGSLRENAVILTQGLLNHLQQRSQNEKEYQNAIKGILGHEMSHIVNKDFLPGLITNAADGCTKLSAHVTYIFVAFFGKALLLIPIVGKFLHYLHSNIYLLYIRLSRFLVHTILFSACNFLQMWFSRSIEYRSDMQSANANGGDSMALALCFLNDGSSYNSIFSTHPNINARIKKVAKVTKISNLITPNIIYSITNFAVIFLMISGSLIAFDKINFQRIKQTSSAIISHNQKRIQLLSGSISASHQKIKNSITQSYQSIKAKFKGTKPKQT